MAHVPLQSTLSAVRSLDEAELARLLKRPRDCPAEVTLPDPVTVLDLATALHAQFFQVVAVLLQHQIFKAANDEIDFATASLVCAHYGVMAHKGS